MTLRTAILAVVSAAGAGGAAAYANGGPLWPMLMLLTLFVVGIVGGVIAAGWVDVGALIGGAAAGMVIAVLASAGISDDPGPLVYLSAPAIWVGGLMAIVAVPAHLVARSIRDPLRRALGVPALAILLVLALAVSLDRPLRLDFYRVIDEQTLAVGTSTGRTAWTRVASVVETPETVTIFVRQIEVSLGPTTGAAYPIELVAKLRAPLGSRIVHDGSSGDVLTRTTCGWPSYLAPGCT